jgi:hypothetical protein
LQTLERPSKVSCRLCTAESVGSNPIGSTQKYADLQAKREGWLEAAELIPSPVLQPNCNAPSKARATSGQFTQSGEALYG